MFSVIKFILGISLVFLIAKYTPMPLFNLTYLIWGIFAFILIVISLNKKFEPRVNAIPFYISFVTFSLISFALTFGYYMVDKQSVDAKYLKAIEHKQSTKAKRKLEDEKTKDSRNKIESVCGEIPSIGDEYETSYDMKGQSNEKISSFDESDLNLWWINCTNEHYTKKTALEELPK